MKIWQGCGSPLEKITVCIPPNLRAEIPFYSDIREFYHNRFSKEYSYYESIIKKFKDIHKGERCFIVGTGPSLEKTNISLIKDEIIFGVNTLYSGLKKFGIECKYYVVGDSMVFKEHYKGILQLDATLFLAVYTGREYLHKKRKYQKYQKKEPIVIRRIGHLYSGWSTEELSTGIYSSDTIVHLALQIAYYMGFKEVYLLGCDCDYSRKHHFNGEAYSFQFKGAKGKKLERWTNWYHSNIFNTYKTCKKVFEDDGRKIYNSTVGGKLDVFERKSLEEVMNDK